MKNLLANVVRTTALFLLLTGFAVAQPPAVAVVAHGTQPRVLIVVAHPDDEVCFAATVYEITHNLGGTVDQLVVTNGEGGYRYSLLAESYYGIALTDEAVGRAELPEIRKRELLDAGRILGITNNFFLDEPDLHYTQDIEEVLRTHWHSGVVLPAIQRRIEGGNYDFVFTLFPSPQTHGGHKAATISALNAVQQMAGRKPVVLGCQNARNGAPAPPSWKGFESAKHPFTVLPQVYSTDRNVKFGFRDALSYQVIVSWMIAAHKSQGMFQAGLVRGDREEFAILESSAADESARTDALFKALAEKAPHPKGVAAPAH
jgi:LmbE family N-acetylglucosaminyl deacetylase